MKETLEDIRTEIAHIDARILQCLHERKSCVERIAEVKQEKHMPLRLPDIEAEVHKRNKHQAQALALEEAFVFQITELIIAQSLRWQKKYLSAKQVTPSEVEGSV